MGTTPGVEGAVRKERNLEESGEGQPGGRRVGLRAHSNSEHVVEQNTPLDLL